MTEKKLRFALFGNEYQTDGLPVIRKTLVALQSHSAEIMADESFLDFMGREHLTEGIDVQGFSGDDFAADFAVSLGGDGTLLRTASRVAAKGIPVIGVNLGRLGFLADVQAQEIEEALAAICVGRYNLAEHSMIQAEAEDGELVGYPIALNDIAVLKRDSASMISIRTEVNGEYLVTYQADGLIVSTPTGSTAYSLSNGGPIIVPQTGTLCLTAVAPHSLNIRPVVLPDDAVVRLSVSARSHNFLVAIDGRSEKLAQGTSLTIRKAPYVLKMVKPVDLKFFSTLRAKMMWGKDERE